MCPPGYTGNQRHDCIQCAIAHKFKLDSHHRRWHRSVLWYSWIFDWPFCMLFSIFFSSNVPGFHNFKIHFQSCRPKRTRSSVWPVLDMQIHASRPPSADSGSVHAEALPWTVSLTTLVLIDQAVFLLDYGQTDADRQTRRRRQKPHTRHTGWVNLTFGVFLVRTLSPGHTHSRPTAVLRH